MRPGATIPGLDAGTKAEVRVAQTWFWDGYFVRRGVDLQHRFGDGVSTVTDLDVLGFAFEPSLRHYKHIGEVKTGKASNTPRALDRALWLRGLRDLVGAESGEVTTSFRPSATVRDVCRRLGATVQHLDDLTARENRLAIEQVNDVGSQGETIALMRKEVQNFVKRDPILERGYWFLISEVWFLRPFDALKRTLGLIRELSKSWPPEAHQDASQTARWFFAEAVSIVTLNLTIIAGQANTMDAQAFRDMASAKLASGDIPSYSVRNLSDRFDEYLGKILTSVDAPAEIRATAMGAFLPSPPDYTEPLIELVSRLAANAASTALLPRQLDAVLFERLVRRRDLAPEIQRRLRLTPNTERSLRLVAAFLRGQFTIPEPVDKVMTTTLFPEPSNVSSNAQSTLFDPKPAEAASNTGPRPARPEACPPTEPPLPELSD